MVRHVLGEELGPLVPTGVSVRAKVRHYDATIYWVVLQPELAMGCRPLQHVCRLSRA